MIYLDYNATTPVAEPVLEAMLPYFRDKFGNAASATHAFGWMAKDGVEHATNQLCELLHCDIKELVFTSGATESVNQAMRGVFEIYRRKGNHIITSSVEHKAVLDTCKALEKQGARVTYLPVNGDGVIDLDQLRREISDSTILVSIIYGNNETGVLQPIREVAEIVHAHQSILMSDATQVVGKIPIDLEEDRIDLMAFSAHKFYGPKGIGGLYVRRKKPRVILSPLIEGGGHQRGMRSGTLNVPGIVGMGAAAALAQDEMAENARKIEPLRDQLIRSFGTIAGFHFHGSGARRLYNTLNGYFEGVRAEDILSSTKSRIAIATGSACTSEDQLPSHVLQAMGCTEDEAYASIRVSLGRETTEADIHEAASIIADRVDEVRRHKVNPAQSG